MTSKYIALKNQDTSLIGVIKLDLSSKVPGTVKKADINIFNEKLNKLLQQHYDDTIIFDNLKAIEIDAIFSGDIEIDVFVGDDDQNSFKDTVELFQTWVF